tara:strand:+ start:197 stop:1033 length:837 start_codon:yes stop_codon:yes gene_type:complete
MSINILIVDGNDKKSSDKLIKYGMNPQYKEYKNTLNLISSKFNITTIHPAIYEDFLPSNISIDEFQGIVWTGSTLNIYDYTPPIIRQIELAKLLLSKKNKIFGSCWGLQVLTTAAGGKVDKNINGLEAVISKDITLNNKGLSHQMYNNKSKKFNAFCWHYDEVKSVPNNSVVLANNTHSFIQALTFKNKKSEFWGVQYHPEFNPQWIVNLMQLRKEVLLKNMIFSNETEYKKMIQILLDISKGIYNGSNTHIDKNIINRDNHYIELKNWLTYLENSYS